MGGCRIKDKPTESTCAHRERHAHLATALIKNLVIAVEGYRVIHRLIQSCITRVEISVAQIQNSRALGWHKVLGSHDGLLHFESRWIIFGGRAYRFAPRKVPRQITAVGWININPRKNSTLPAIERYKQRPIAIFGHLGRLDDRCAVRQCATKLDSTKAIHRDDPITISAGAVG